MTSGYFENLYIALIHYPIRNKQGELVTTAITNMDIHDISRSARTFGVRRYYLVNPLDSQIMLVERILRYWSELTGAKLVPSRQEALALAKVIPSLEDVIAEITRVHHQAPLIVTTSAQAGENRIGIHRLREILQANEKPILILFGTGYGLIDEIIDKSDYILEPIHGAFDYNHLSVRSAVAIILDRLTQSTTK
jgi:hypothetical protein